ncbi:glycosyltransferase family 39 protein [Flaviflexus massiliensis]|uniref:glycosyltransferase family 39 protein n=1 Tax=Flaviflexus massiliensis TaxID=1522309 RepID=UPI0006D5670C|nr:glycosyltransferase family 39 protein [Flaviflexus massiliensis]
MPEWGVALLLAVASLLWSTIAIIASPGLSRYDEWTYIDYSYQVSNGIIPVQGDDLSEYARQAWSCRGMEGDIRGVVPPPCNEVADHPATDWPFEGENYNTFHPPLYFAFAGGAGKALGVIGVDFTDGARIASALLGAAGAACLYLAIRSWAVRRRNSVGATLIAMSAPALAQSAAIVHNDAISMLAGAAAVWMAARIFKHGNHGWVLPFVLTALISTTRTMSVVAVLAVGILAFLVALFQDEKWKRLKPALGVALGTALPYVLWTAFQSSRRPADYVPSITGLSTEPFEIGDSLAVLNTIVGGGAPWGLTSPAGDWYLHPDLNSGLLEGWSWMLYVAFLILIPSALYVAVRNTGPARHLAILVVILPIVTALIVQGREILSNGAYFRAISGRYAITAVPMYVTFIGILFERVKNKCILLVIGLVGYAALLLSPLL